MNKHKHGDIEWQVVVDIMKTKKWASARGRLFQIELSQKDNVTLSEVREQAM